MGTGKEGVAVGLGELELAGGRSDDRLKRILGVFGKSLTLSNGKDGHRKPKDGEVMAGSPAKAHGLDQALLTVYRGVDKVPMKVNNTSPYYLNFKNANFSYSLYGT